MTNRTKVLLAALGAVLWGLAQPGDAAAQCAGDCNADGQVAINELIVGVNIALGSSPVSACPSFDGNSDGEVAINELIAAVNVALNGCVLTETPTATVSATPTATPTTGTPVPGICGNGSNCGDGFADVLGQNGQRETCDDRNTIDDDGCPANCCVEPCELTAQRLRVAVDFATVDPEVFLIGLDVFLRYQDGVIDVPGIGDSPAVLAAVTSDIFATTPRDFDYGVRVLFDDPTFVGYNEGTAATVEFGLCAGATAPPPSSIDCIVKNGTDANFGVVTPEQITCTLTAAP